MCGLCRAAAGYAAGKRKPPDPKAEGLRGAAGCCGGGYAARLAGKPARSFAACFASLSPNVA